MPTMNQIDQEDVQRLESLIERVNDLLREENEPVYHVMRMAFYLLNRCIEEAAGQTGVSRARCADYLRDAILKNDVDAICHSCIECGQKPRPLQSVLIDATISNLSRVRFASDRSRFGHKISELQIEAACDGKGLFS